MKNLYNFSKNSNHVKLFKWLWNVDPTKTFKSMCPYFWSYVATILILPIILIAKLFGKYGKQFNSYLYTFKSKRETRIENKLIERASKITTEKEGYDLITSRCYRKYKWALSSEERDRLGELYYTHIENVKRAQSKANLNRAAKVQEAKDSKIVMFFVWIVIGIAVATLGYSLYLLCAMAVERIDWWKVLKGLGIITAIGAGAFTFFGLIKYVGIPIYDRLKCINLPKCKLCQLPIGAYIISFFRAIGNGIMILIDMIRNTYKKSCPIITWEDK